MLAPPRRVGAPSSGKSWIRHWFRNIFLNCSLYDSSDVASAEEIPAPPNTRASSPTPSVTQEHADIMLPHAEPIPPEHMVMARQWMPVRLFRNKSFSTYWAHRECFNSHQMSASLGGCPAEVNQFEQISNDGHQMSQAGGGSLSVKSQMSLDYSIRWYYWLHFGVNMCRKKRLFPKSRVTSVLSK